jgi:hypothetical protein
MENRSPSSQKQIPFPLHSSQELAYIRNNGLQEEQHEHRLPTYAFIIK